MNSHQVLDALEHDLVRKPDQPAGLLLREIGAPDGLRRADAIWLPAGHSRGLTGFEVKVSRADVLTELASPHKCESWKRFCRHWWLVVADESLIEGLTIPHDWGVKTPPTQANRRAFRILKAAPELDPTDLAPAMVRLGTIWAYERSRSRRQSAMDKGHLNTVRGTVAKLELRLREAGVNTGDRPSGSLQQAQDFLDALMRQGQYMRLPTGDLDALATAVIEHLKIKNLRAKVAAELEDRVEQINRSLNEFGESWRTKDLLREIRRSAELVRAGGTP